MGAPSYKWTAEVEDELFNRVAKAEAIRNICGSNGLPAWETFRKRLNSDETFQARYARAKEDAADTLFDQVLSIADSQEGDVIQVDGNDSVNHDNINRARLRIDARKWLAGKLRPKVYGDKIDVNNKHDMSDPMAEMFAQIASQGRRIGKPDD